MVERAAVSTYISGMRASLAELSFSLRGALTLASALMLVMVVAVAMVPTDVVHASTITVNDATDTIHSPGCSTTGSGTCSLRDAIIFANSNPGADTVAFSASLNGVAITLSILNAGGNNEDDCREGDLDVTDDLTIQGNGALNTIIQAGTSASNGIDKVFGLNPICDHAVNVTIDGVTVRYGRNTQTFGAGDWSYTGGGIDFCGYDNGSLTISNSVISDNTNVNAYGGGLNIDTVQPGTGTITITNTTITNNKTLSTTNEANGAGINFFGDQPNLVITNSTISNNTTAGTTAGGAGIYIRPTYGGSVAIHDSIISNNTAGGNGGGIFMSIWHASTTVTIDQGTRIVNNVSGGVTNGAAGGSGLFIGGSALTTTPVTLSKVIITGNSESPLSRTTDRKGGGGIYVDGANVNISYSRIASNTVLSASGGTGLLKNIDTGAVTAQNNWWGCSAGPSASPCDTAVILAGSAGSLTPTPYLRLSLTAGSPTIKTNQTSPLTASFNANSAGTDVSANIDVLLGLPVSWSAAGGTVTGSQTTIQTSGTATATFNATNAGADSATAVVDNGPLSGGPNTASITVNKADTTATITSDTPDPTVTGQPVTVSYTVSSETGSTPTAPSGNVTVTDGVSNCTGTLAAGSCGIALTSAGSKTLTATYNGDANFNTSPASAGALHTVNKASTTTAITSHTPDPSLVGQAVAISFTVAVVVPGSGTPTGDVTVTDGVNSCTATVAAGSCSIAFSSVGIKTLTATYSGDSGFNGSTSAGVTQTVNKANTTTAITSDTPDPSGIGQMVTVTFTVTSGAGTPTGSVTVSDGTVNCTATVAAGGCTLTPITAGTKTLTATYAGDANFNGSVSAGEAHTVNKADTVTTIAAHTPDPSAAGQIVVVSFTVTSSFGTPTGNVTVTDGVNSCTGSVASGSCAITLMTPGDRTLAATYAGDANFNGSTTAVSHGVLDHFILTVSKAGTGSGTVGGAGQYLQRTTATVTADADAGSTFINWSGHCAGAASPTTVLMDGPKTCVATFDDTQAPDLTVSTLSDGSWTNNNTLNISGTATDNTGAPHLTIIGIDVTIQADGSFSHAVVLAEGPNVIETTATDLAGNETKDTRTITFDPNAPQIAITTPPDNSTTNQSPIAVSGTVDETSTVVVTVNGGGPVPAQMNGTDFTLMVALTYGINTIEVMATDLAGNTSTLKRTVTYDDINPSLSITEPAQDIRTNQDTQLLKGEVTDLTGVVVTITMDGGTFTPPVVNGRFEQLLTFTSEKIYQISAKATDEAGNETTVQRNIVYDKTPPGLTLDPVTSPTNSKSQALTGGVESQAAVSVTCSTANVGEVAYPTATTWRVLLTNMAEGNNEVKITAIDEAGNISSEMNANIIVDTIPPETTITSKPGDPSFSSSATFSFTSAEPGSTFLCRLDNGSYSPCSSPRTYASLTEGSHTFSVIATDWVGNADETAASSTWTIVFRSDLSGTWRELRAKFGRLISGVLQVRNTGNKNASYFRVSYYLSEDGVTLGKMLRQTSISGLRAGSTRDLNFWHVSLLSMSGKYIIAVIDPGSQISEADENNNRAAGTIP